MTYIVLIVCIAISTPEADWSQDGEKVSEAGGEALGRERADAVDALLPPAHVHRNADCVSH